jgi:hypothetical protein
MKNANQVSELNVIKMMNFIIFGQAKYSLNIIYENVWIISHLVSFSI